MFRWTEREPVGPNQNKYVISLWINPGDLITTFVWSTVYLHPNHHDAFKLSTSLGSFQWHVLFISECWRWPLHMHSISRTTCNSHVWKSPDDSFVQGKAPTPTENACDRYWMWVKQANCHWASWKLNSLCTLLPFWAGWFRCGHHWNDKLVGGMVRDCRWGSLTRWDSLSERQDRGVEHTYWVCNDHFQIFTIQR